ncbi:M16 family metallopeptidase [Peredibacter sp. HCB2-198]|uniref:M16 family metallopeptidase n=1 Tax=Peredibacter sp. HCB2-198 TaxID=3383025 RepID=UPI0038B461D4
MKLMFPLLLLALLFNGCASRKKEESLADSINLDVKEVKLENGMTALIVNNPKLPIFSLYFFYKVGGKNEVPGITGASHFLEHMMFKGAKKFGKNTLDFIIEGSGGSTNAYTTNDQTVYYENLPSSELSMILDIEADRMENLTLDEDDFNKERAVVLEERKMRYENSPRGQLYQLMMSSLFAGTPYGRPVIGDIPDIKSVTREQMHAYFKRFYAPNNVTLVLVGDVDTSKARDMIEEKFGKIPSSATVTEAHASLKDEEFQPKLSESKVVNQKGESPNPMFMLSYPTYKIGDQRGYALDVLSSILGSGKSSALINEYILINRPVATSMYAAHQQLEKAGFFFIGGELVRGVKLEEFRADLQKKLHGFCETEVTPRSIQKIKNNYLVDLYAGLDTNAGLAGFLGDRQQLLGDWRFYKEELRNYEKVTVEDVKSACHETFAKKNVFVSVWNQHK